MKKKLLAMVIAIIFVLTNAITIYANTTDTVTAESDKTELKAGETFTITLNVSAPSGIAAVTGFSYSYDTNKLILDEEKVASTFMSFDEDNVRTLMYVGEQATNTQMATLTFTVKEGVSAGTTTVSFGEMIVSSMDNPNVQDNTPVLVQPINITVIEEITPPPTECSHTYEIKYNNTHHWRVCSKCDEEETGSRVAHNLTYTDNQNGTTHTATCTGCAYSTTATHEFNNGKCDSCGAVESTGGEGCDHTTYEFKHSETEHWRVCKECGQEQSGSRGAHEFTYTDNRNGTHNKTCEICKYEIVEEHDFNNGKCEDCKAVEPVDDECDHTYEMGSSDKQHWEACTKCGQIKSGTLKTHTYDSYKNNNDGTHTATCTKCGHEHKESHATNVACDKCGYKPTTNNNNGGTTNGGTSNGGNNNGANKDNTVVDKEIPKAGLNVMLVFGIAVIVAVAIIMYNKNQKYKDIK